MIGTTMLIVVRVPTSNFAFMKFFCCCCYFLSKIDSVHTESMDYNHMNSYVYYIYTYNTLFQDSEYK